MAKLVKTRWQQTKELRSNSISKQLIRVRQSTIKRIAGKIYLFENAGSLMSMADDGTGLKSLLENLDSSNPRIRHGALCALRNYAKKRKFKCEKDIIITSVIHVLEKETNESVREKAAEFFASVNDKRAVAPLVKATEDIGPFRSCMDYVKALSNNPDLDAVPTFLFMLRSNHNLEEIIKRSLIRILDECPDSRQFIYQFEKGVERLIRSVGRKENLNDQQERIICEMNQRIENRMKSEDVRISFSCYRLGKA